MLLNADIDARTRYCCALAGHLDPIQTEESKLTDTCVGAETSVAEWSTDLFESRVSKFLQSTSKKLVWQDRSVQNCWRRPEDLQAK